MKFCEAGVFSGQIAQLRYSISREYQLIFSLAVNGDTSSPPRESPVRVTAAPVADGGELAGASFPVRSLVIVDRVALHGRLVLHAWLRSIQVQASIHHTAISGCQHRHRTMNYMVIRNKRPTGMPELYICEQVYVWFHRDLDVELQNLTRSSLSLTALQL